MAITKQTRIWYFNLRAQVKLVYIILDMALEFYDIMFYLLYTLPCQVNCLWNYAEHHAVSVDVDSQVTKADVKAEETMVSWHDASHNITITLVKMSEWRCGGDRQSEYLVSGLFFNVFIFHQPLFRSPILFCFVIINLGCLINVKWMHGSWHNLPSPTSIVYSYA